MKILGISGTNGSGKDTVSQMLADDHGWLFVSASADLIIPELKRRGLSLEREQMAALTAEWNRQNKGAVVDKAVELYKKKSENQRYEGLVISSIRHPWEVGRIHELGGRIVWVDAPARLRYARINARGQGDKDKKTFEQFLAEEETEMHQSGDEATLQTAAVKNKADIFINNAGATEDIKEQVKKALNLS